MTDNRETIEMLKILKEQALKSHNDTAVLEVKIDSFNFVLDEAIKALEQQPCDDYISRQAVLDLVVSNHIKLNELNVVMYSPLCKDIKALPPVTPKEKTGHWIDEADDIDAQFDRHEYKCSVCGRIANYYVGGNECWWDIYKPNFCPNCGARMVSE